MCACGYPGVNLWVRQAKMEKSYRFTNKPKRWHVQRLKHRIFLGMRLNELEKDICRWNGVPCLSASRAQAYIFLLNKWKRWQLGLDYEIWYSLYYTLNKIQYLFIKEGYDVLFLTSAWSRVHQGWLIPFYRWIDIEAKHSVEQGHIINFFSSSWSPHSGPWCFSLSVPEVIPAGLWVLVATTSRALW